MIAAIRNSIARACRVAPAAPAGGARHWRGRGCLSALCGLAVIAASDAGADIALSVPSGQPVHLADVLLDENPGELWLRFRFVAPRIGAQPGQVGHDVASFDMDHLCQELAVPYVATHELQPALVVISLSNQKVDFGLSDPDVTQFFEAYRLENAECVWEEY